ncbi:hypothetical protein PS928_04300 [Pseudomonas fluorescens]|uniref:Uncharacterized protein n=1 Tax=Pseudomonas fluorescens TaxID=294 RepID=A0A5E7UYU4_PSEFL|nr:hypothetical protein PS928_04300 [Pseudomonas fluorescens]
MPAVRRRYRQLGQFLAKALREQAHLFQWGVETARTKRAPSSEVSNAMSRRPTPSG